jgi:hypothetical protein
LSLKYESGDVAARELKTKNNDGGQPVATASASASASKAMEWQLFCPVVVKAGEARLRRLPQDDHEEQQIFRYRNEDRMSEGEKREEIRC